MGASINIALLGNCTTDYIAKALTQSCADYNISANVYNCPFRQYNQEIFNKESGFYTSKPELTILFLEGMILFPQWYEVGSVMNSADKKHSFIKAVFDSLISLVEEIHASSDSVIIMNNFKMPHFSPLGILDNKYFPGLKDMISLLNLELAQWASDKDYLYIFDYCAFTTHYGNENLYDPKMFYITNTTIALPYTVKLAKEYLRYILPLRFMSKKCLVLDLDNTLWGGVAGEDGISGIKLDITGTGRSFYDFQKQILNLYYKGIILAINSKNNLEDAMTIIEKHPHMVLNKEHFSAIKINWDDKVKNLIAISKELNIGIDSIVFFDDSVIERELVKSMLPEVTVIDVPADTSKYSEAIRNIIEFEYIKLTDEDLSRNSMYSNNKERNGAQQKFSNVEDYLKSLKTKVILEYSNEFSIPRIAQLTQKTNQFNMTTKRYTQEDIESFHNSQDYVVISIKVKDIYGDNGLTGVCIVKIDGNCARIDTFLLSCRVLGRNVEFAFLNKIISLLQRKGIDTVYASYLMTEKNKVNENFYLRAGFSTQESNANEFVYYMDGNNLLNNIEYIAVIAEGDN